MTNKEAKKMIPFVQYSYNTANFVRGSYTANEWFDLVDKALGKQIPKKPNIEICDNRVLREQEQTVCPNCNDWVGWDYKSKYCCNCGQRLLWEE